MCPNMMIWNRLLNFFHGMALGCVVSLSLTHSSLSIKNPNYCSQVQTSLSFLILAGAFSFLCLASCFLRRGVTLAPLMELPLPMCHCWEVATMRTSRTEANHGRRFLGCRHFEVSFTISKYISWVKLGMIFAFGMQASRACGYFQWYDPPVHSHSRVAIVGLLCKISNPKGEVARGRRHKAISVILLMLVPIMILISLKFRAFSLEWN